MSYYIKKTFNDRPARYQAAICLETPDGILLMLQERGNT
jgi:hypothetical protein